MITKEATAPTINDATQAKFSDLNVLSQKADNLAEKPNFKVCNVNKAYPDGVC